MSESEARAHIDRFNAAVLTGDWAELVATLHPDATMTFVGPPVGPFHGRDAIASAYAENPPDDTMRPREVTATGATEVVTFEWTRGGTGTLTITRDAGLIRSLLIVFD
ncbi:nuclear transport factor 2 family protein [Actinoplanes sp. NPDC051470]|uniref:nuclear transport factor 2 family protein n=1 Tax=unclassified Actinoplanes TaxID=2626549 RepID=UPI00343C6703